MQAVRRLLRRFRLASGRHGRLVIVLELNRQKIPINTEISSVIVSECGDSAMQVSGAEDQL